MVNIIGIRTTTACSKTTHNNACQFVLQTMQYHRFCKSHPCIDESAAPKIPTKRLLTRHPQTAQPQRTLTWNRTRIWPILCATSILFPITKRLRAAISQYVFRRPKQTGWANNSNEFRVSRLMCCVRRRDIGVRLKGSRWPEKRSHIPEMPEPGRVVAFLTCWP